MTFSLPRVKICCISSIAEARMAISHGASALGLVGHMPSGPGVIGDDRIREIARSVPPPVATFLLTSETRAEAVIEHYRKVQTSVIQLVDLVKPYGVDLCSSVRTGGKLDPVKLDDFFKVIGAA